MAYFSYTNENMTVVSWLAVLIIACWGGLVRYFIDIRRNKTAWGWRSALNQIVVSGFTGTMSGLISTGSGLNIYMMLAAAGISGAMGSAALTYFWERLTGVKDESK